MKTKKYFIILISLFIGIFLFTNCDISGTVSDIIEPLLTRTPDPVTPLDTYNKQECDYLFIMYVDGDNDLHDALYLDLNEMEEALYKYSQNKGSKPSVKIVALWDGWKLAGTNYGGTATQILELRADSSCNDTQLCSNTLDLTATAKDWINYDATKKTGEVNMGDKLTLINFLEWVDEYYEAEHKILQFSNHGGGPRSALDISQRRGLCWDYTSDEKNAFLKTKDVSDAFAEAGYGKDKEQFDMLIFDVCLGASIEDSYQFRNYAKYLLGSANTVPGNGLDYTKILNNISTDTTIPDIGKGIIDDFKYFYTVTLPASYPEWSERWENEIAYWQSEIDKLSETEKANLPNNYAISLATFSLPDACTFSLIDLSKVDEVANAVDELADYLGGKESPVGNYGFYMEENNPDSAITYQNYIGGLYLSCYVSFGKPVYQGTFTWLHDIGFMAANIANFCSNLNIPNTDNTETEINEAEFYDVMKNNLKKKAETVTTALKNAILFTWREGPYILGENYDSLYYGAGTECPYGMTIAGSTVASNGTNSVDGYAPDFYETDLDFGEDYSWGDLLEYYFGTGKNND